MNYGLYLSASGVMNSSHRQEVIANNLANVETVGFKRHTAHFRQRLSEALTGRGQGLAHDPRFAAIGGGTLFEPTRLDATQGELEQTSNPLDAALLGEGYFSVKHQGQTRLTRDGRFMIDPAGQLVLADGTGSPVLDPQGNPIVLEPGMGPELRLAADGTISHRDSVVGRVGIFNVADPRQLVKVGGNLFKAGEAGQIRATGGQIRAGFVERSNVDPSAELVALMQAQRELEANANMIRYQDQTLGRLVNEVGKIG